MPDHELEPMRREIRAFLARMLTPEMRRRVHATGTVHDWTFHRAVADAGWIGAAWPAEEGGSGRSLVEVETFLEEAVRAGAPLDGLYVTMYVAETVRRVGQPDLKRELLPRVIAGDVLLALGYSEPGAGSDVAAASTHAARQPDGSWRLTGQKAFTTLAHEADYVFVLARTATTTRKQDGLTLFLVSTSAPGFSLDPIHTMGGERTNMTYYDDVPVPDGHRVGEVGGGWAVLMLALSLERGGEMVGQLLRLGDLGIDWAAGRAGSRADGFELIADQVGRLIGYGEVARSLSRRAADLRAEEAPAGVEGAMSKLFASEQLERGSSRLLALMGEQGLTPPTELAEELQAIYRHAPVTTIYAGTNEVMRSIIAEGRLGLPRSR